MLKVILGTLTSVFLAIISVTIFYWKDAKFDPSTQQMYVYLLIFPCVISIVLLTPYFILKWYKYQKNKKLAAKEHAEQQQVSENSGKEIEIEHIQFQIFTSSIETAFGQNDEIIHQLINIKTPSLDEFLENNKEDKAFSYRVTTVDREHFNQKESHDLKPIQQRIIALMSNELKKNIELLTLITKHLRLSALFYDGELAYKYRMHPLWTNPDIKVADDPEEKQPLQVYRLDHICIHLIFSDLLLHVWDEAITDQIVSHFLEDLGLIHQQIKTEYHYWGANNAYFEWIKLLQKTQNQVHQVSFILVIDSEIDQDILTSRYWDNENYVPAEFMSSCCIAATSVNIENLDAIKNLHIYPDASNIKHALIALDISDLEQFQHEKPFVFIPDNITKPITIEKISNNFKQSPIAQYHHLYTQNSLGDTRHLIEIYTFMLGMHTSKDSYSFIYSLALPSVQVIFGPIQPEDVINQPVL
ncbi:hypothetical protein [Acinetobacter boissieri]|uniref:Uncharacterized protein n=1 Tax=Acinetobacter boissieri TaxID=1219383 RepID=A0A1G6ILA3_9GAMM|nr:hypothetical protein [Acinetobacter boissieri]SDC06775.1 hypothetical protein SAMN05421733_108164 [Acinetobacter boissieri]